MTGLPEETTPTPAENQRRISTALKKLLPKCTEEGATPADGRIGSLVDCMAEHFKAGSDDFIITVDISADTISADKKAAEIMDAVKSNKVIKCKVKSLSYEFPLVSATYDNNSYNSGTFVFEVPYMRISISVDVSKDTVTLNAEEIAYVRFGEAVNSGFLRLKSSTSGSSKVFAITVDDGGTLTATEVS